jgi:hypothetical protein
MMLALMITSALSPSPPISRHLGSRVSAGLSRIYCKEHLRYSSRMAAKASASGMTGEKLIERMTV